MEVFFSQYQLAIVANRIQLETHFRENRSFAPLSSTFLLGGASSEDNAEYWKKISKTSNKKRQSYTFFFVPWCALAKNIEHIQPKKKTKQPSFFHVRYLERLGWPSPFTSLRTCHPPGWRNGSKRGKLLKRKR